MGGQCKGEKNVKGNGERKGRVLGGGEGEEGQAVVLSMEGIGQARVIGGCCTGLR